MNVCVHVWTYAKATGSFVRGGERECLRPLPSPSSFLSHGPLSFSVFLPFLLSRSAKWKSATSILPWKSRSFAQAGRGRLFCAWCATKFEFTQLINARQVYRARWKMRFSRLPSSCLSSHPFNTACVSRRSRDSLKVGRLLFKPLDWLLIREYHCGRILFSLREIKEFVIEGKNDFSKKCCLSS